MAKASEQMEKALKVSECVPEIGTGRLHTGVICPGEPNLLARRYPNTKVSSL